MKTRPSRRVAPAPHGFSLIELGIVLAVIVVLSSVVLLGRGFMEAAKTKNAVDMVVVLREAGRQWATRQCRGLQFKCSSTIGPGGTLDLDLQRLVSLGLVPANLKSPWDSQQSHYRVEIKSEGVTATCSGDTCMRICVEVPSAETCEDLWKLLKPSSREAGCNPANKCGLGGAWVVSVVTR